MENGEDRVTACFSPPTANNLIYSVNIDLLFRIYVSPSNATQGGQLEYVTKEWLLLSETNKQNTAQKDTIPEALDISKVQHLVTKVGKHEREDGILHEVIERAARHLV